MIEHNFKVGDKVRINYSRYVQTKTPKNRPVFETQGVVVRIGPKKIIVDVGGFRHRLYWASSLEKMEE